MLQQFHRVALVHLHPRSEHVGIQIVRPLLNQRAPLDSLNQLFDRLDLQNNDPLDPYVFLKQVGLPNCPRQPVEKKELLGREIAVGRNQPMDEMVPDLDRDLVGE